MKLLYLFPAVFMISSFPAFSENNFESDIIKSSEGNIKITFYRTRIHSFFIQGYQHPY